MADDSRADGQALSTGEQRNAMSVWRAIRAESRAEGIENIKVVNGILFYVVADAYRAAREENPEWPRGSDAQWSRDSGIQKQNVGVLSKLWAESNTHITFRTWAEARNGAYGTPISATLDGKAVDATLLPAEPDRWSSKRARLFNETASDLVLRLDTMLENDFPRLNDAEQTVVQHKLLQARKDVNSIIRKLKKGGPNDAQ